MKIFLKIEFNRLLKAWSFWVSIGLGLLLSISQYIMNPLNVVKYLDVYKKLNNPMITPHSVFNNWIGGEASSFQHYIFFMIIPILCVMPWSTSLYTDIKSGLVKNYFTRASKLKYFTSKYIITFLTGGIVIAMPLLLNLYLSSITLPSILPEASMGTYGVGTRAIWSSLFYTHPYIYCYCYILLIFIFSGLISTTALALGTWINNIFTIFLMPFITCLFLYTIFQREDLLKFVPVNFLDPDQSTSNNSIVVVCAEAALLLLISLLGISAGAKNDTI